METAEKLPENQEEIAAEGNLRDDLEAAIESIEQDDSKEQSVSMDGLLPDEAESAVRKKDKEPAEKEPEAKPEEIKAEEPEKKEPESLEAGGDEEEPAEKKGKTPKAPVGWGAKARESWSKVPPEVQEEISKREKEIATSMQGTQEARRTHEAIQNLSSSYAPIMAAEGVNDPLVAIKGLFDTVAQLRVGSPVEKAQKMAHLIKHYGVDINALDAALVGEAPEASANSEMEHLINQKMQPVNELLSELQQRQQQAVAQTEEEANKAVSEFQGEFLQDVRLDMADLIDMAAQRGQSMTLQQAYDKAVLLNPEIQTILEKRKSDAAILGEKQNINKKKEAASIVSGTKIGDGSGGGDVSLRDTISGAWEDVEGGI